MKIPWMKSVPTLGPRQSIGLIVAAVLTAAAVSGWAKSTMFTTEAVKVEDTSQVGSMIGGGNYALPPLW